VLYDPAFAVVATWFHRRRARALTILTFIAGFASIVFVPLAQQLVQRQGWRAALVTLAVVLAVTTVPAHALVLRRRPRDHGWLPDGRAAEPDAARVATVQTDGVRVRAALHAATFWWMTAAFALSMFTGTAIIVHLVPYLLERGYAGSFAAGMIGLIGLVALPGRVVFTELGDRVERQFVAAALFWSQALAVLALLLLPSTPGVLLFVVLFGAAFGSITPARAALLAERYGAHSYASINSVLGLFVTGARALAPVGAGILFDRLGTYQPLFVLLVALSTLAGGAMLLAHGGQAAATQPLS